MRFPLITAFPVDVLLVREAGRKESQKLATATKDRCCPSGLRSDGLASPTIAFPKLPGFRPRRCQHRLPAHWCLSPKAAIGPERRSLATKLRVGLPSFDLDWLRRTRSQRAQGTILGHH